MSALEEWEKHIRDPHADNEGKSICGADVANAWCFTSIDHAFSSVRYGSRLLPCPDCARIVVRALSAGED